MYLPNIIIIIKTRINIFNRDRNMYVDLTGTLSFNVVHANTSKKVKTLTADLKIDIFNCRLKTEQNYILYIYTGLIFLMTLASSK